MKKYLKNSFPVFFKIFSFIYRHLPIVKRKRILNENIRIEKKRKSIQIEKTLLNEIFDNKYLVYNGPFKGLKYINKSSGSTLLPKILGSYEEPIQDWVYEIIQLKKYDTILDIGCAEGYYACGFALSLQNTRVIAFDTDPLAMENLKEMIKLNSVKNIELKSECTHDILSSFSKSRVLIFCDIEGGELQLLDLNQVPNLKKCDLIIESHDCFIPGITEILIDRFYHTHKIRLAVDYPFRLNKYYTPRPISRSQFYQISNECRPSKMKFLYLESNYEEV